MCTFDIAIHKSTLQPCRRYENAIFAFARMGTNRHYFMLAVPTAHTFATMPGFTLMTEAVISVFTTTDVA